MNNKILAIRHAAIAADALARAASNKGIVFTLHGPEVWACVDLDMHGGTLPPAIEQSCDIVVVRNNIREGFYRFMKNRDNFLPEGGFTRDDLLARGLSKRIERGNMLIYKRYGGWTDGDHGYPLDVNHIAGYVCAESEGRSHPALSAHGAGLQRSVGRMWERRTHQD